MKSIYALHIWQVKSRVMTQHSVCCLYRMGRYLINVRPCNILFEPFWFEGSAQDCSMPALPWQQDSNRVTLTFGPLPG